MLVVKNQANATNGALRSAGRAKLAIKPPPKYDVHFIIQGAIVVEILLVACFVLLIAVFALQIAALLRRAKVDLTPVDAGFKSMDQFLERHERLVREELVQSRTESGAASQRSRQELTGNLQKVANVLLQNIRAGSTATEQRLGSMRDTIEQRLGAIQTENGQKLEVIRQESASSAKNARDEVTASLKTFCESIVQVCNGLSDSQRLQLGDVVVRLSKFTETTELKLENQRTTVDQRLQQIHVDSAGTAKQSREEMNLSLKNFNDSLLQGVGTMSTRQKDEMEGLRKSVEDKLKFIQDDTGKLLLQIHTESTSTSKQSREEMNLSLKNFNDSLLQNVSQMSSRQKDEMEALRKSVEEKLKAIQDDNGKQLEQMRQTVDEKLQGTLETRLGESFKQVSDRLEQVHKGLGEMQSLATGVGDLKKVLTNVKSRGTWGEVQLASLLEQVLTPDQFDTNVATKGGSERVEFAIKLPGRSNDPDEVVWLPIDAKFPTEDYQRLVEAHDKGDVEGAELAAKQLENRIKGCAKDICEKYLNPPKTTDFAILFLPTEGLFAEVVRRVGVTEIIQRECRVVIAGPTTLWSLLNSLQMGFRTLVIEKRSSEVWNLLGAVKTEWSKYGLVLDKVQKKLEQASNTIEDAQKRSRAIERKLRGVEELPEIAAREVLMLPDGSSVEDDD